MDVVGIREPVMRQREREGWTFSSTLERMAVLGMDVPVMPLLLGVTWTCFDGATKTDALGIIAHVWQLP